MAPLDNFTLIGLPYVALVVFLVGTIYRYKMTKFSYSSLSSQFLEGRQLFWGTMPFHWGILFLFAGHLVAFLVPRGLLAFNSHPVRLLIIEVSALMFGLIVLVGLITLFVRRTANPRLRVVTTRMDMAVFVLLIVEVILGLSVALGYRWGSSWFASVITPYLRSVMVLQPEIGAVASMPWVVKLHIILSYLIFMLIPFTRLVHLLVVPFHYIWRPYQLVVWSWDRRRVRRDDNEWSATKPTNN
jgi:nitrate reductase gamma subunit